MRIQLLYLLLFLVPAGNLFAQADTLVTIGGTTDFSSIEPDGTLEFHGNATVWDDYVVPLTSAKAAGVSPAGLAAFMGGVFGITFGSTSTEEVFFSVQMPHSWAGTAIYPHIHWSPSDNTTGNVVWGIEYTWIEYDPDSPKTFPSTTTSTITVSASGTAHDHLIAIFPSINITTDTDGISSIIMMRLFREPDAVPANNYSGDAFGLSFDIHYERNTVGSRREFIK